MHAGKKKHALSTLTHSLPRVPQVSGATMPVSLLWAVDVYGRVYSLSTAGLQWEQCRDAQMEFKRVTAAKQCCWGIACDNNVYLNVHASDLPVRYQEETYENQVRLFHRAGCPLFTQSLFLEKEEDAYLSQSLKCTKKGSHCISSFVM